MLETLAIAWRVTLRHWDVYRQNLLPNIAPTFSDPIFFMLALGIGLGAYVSDMGGMPYIRFLAPGLAVATALWTAFFETSYGFFIRHTYEGVYQAMLTTPIGPREIIIGEFIWVALKGAGMSLGVTVILMSFGLASPWTFWMIPFISAVVAVACGSIGFIASGMVRNINQFQTVYAFLINPLFFFSGVFFPLEGMPWIVRALCQLSPLYHGVRMGQAVFWNENIPATMLYHGPWLLLLTLILVPLAAKTIHPKLYR